MRAVARFNFLKQDNSGYADPAFVVA